MKLSSLSLLLTMTVALGLGAIPPLRAEGATVAAPQLAPAATTWTWSAVKTKARTGEAVAQHELGRRYEHGIGVRPSTRRAVSWYRKAAEQNLPRAQYSLARLLTEGATDQADRREALRWFHRAAAQGYSLAQNRLGMIHLRGQGVAPDAAEARRWFSLAAAASPYGAASANLRAMTRETVPGERWVAE